MSMLRVAVMCSTLMLVAAPRANAQQREQTAFSVEDSAVKNPVALPTDVLELLKTDPLAAPAFEGDAPASCFSASAIRLGSRMTDLIVEGVGTLRGANVTVFWVFVAISHGHRLVLAGPAYDLMVENRRTSGYRDITMKEATAKDVTTAVYKFNGTKYALHHDEAKPIQ